MIAKDGTTKYRIWTHLSFRTWARGCSGVRPSQLSFGSITTRKGLPWKPRAPPPTRCHTAPQTLILYEHTERFLLLNFKTSMPFTSPELITTHFSWARPGLSVSSLCLIRWGCRFRSAAKPAVIRRTRESQSRGARTTPSLTTGRWLSVHQGHTPRFSAEPLVGVLHQVGEVIDDLYKGKQRCTVNTPKYPGHLNALSRAAWAFPGAILPVQPVKRHKLMCVLWKLPFWFFKKGGRGTGVVKNNLV